MNRTDESRTIAVVRTRLPYTDRRSLSQAWFSALHLSEGPHATPPQARSGGAHASAPAQRNGVPRQAGVRDALAPAGVRYAEPHTRGTARETAWGADCALPRAAARSASATVAMAERARRHVPLRTSLTVGVAGERVALLLRREGATLHVVAVCRPAVESAVRHALALAAAQVRAHGEALRASVHPLGSRP